MSAVIVNKFITDNILDIMDETKFGDVFRKLLNLVDLDRDGMSIQEMFDHRFELLRLQELGLKLLDEIEARHS